MAGRKRGAMFGYVMVCLTTSHARHIPLTPDTATLKYLNLYINITLPAVVCECETWSDILKDKRQNEGGERNVSNGVGEGNKQVEKNA
jgi:hypothetical protein